MAKLGKCMLCRQELFDAEIFTTKYGVTMQCKNCSTFHFISYRGLLR